MRATASLPIRRSVRVSRFCPEDCVRLNEEEPLQHRDCLHLEDVVMPTPYSAIYFGRVVTVIGINGNDFYIEEMMTNGQTSRSVVSRDRIKRS